MGGLFAKNAVWLMLRDGYTLVLTLLVGVFCARYLGPGGYGLLNYSMSFVSLFAAFCQLGLDASVTQALVDTPSDAGNIIGSALALRTAAAAVSQFALLACVSLVGGSDGWLLTLTLLQGVSLLFDSRPVLDYYFQYRRESRNCAVAQMAGVTLMCVMRAVCILVRADISWFALATVAQSLMSLLVSAALFRGREKLSFSFARAGRLMSCGKHFMLAGAASALYTQIDRLMIGAMLTNEDVGWYSVAIFVALVGRFVPDAFISSARPILLRLERESPDAFIDGCRALVFVVLAVGAVFGAALLTLGPMALRLVYGAAYAPAESILRVLCLATLFSALNRVRDLYLLAKGLNRYSLIFALLGAGVNIALNLFLIPRFGVMGAAAATLISYVTTSLLAPMAFGRTRPFTRLLSLSPAKARAALRTLKSLGEEDGA